MESSKSNLMNKNFICEICEKSFSTNQSKNRHVRFHHGEKKFFECNICGKGGFGLKWRLIIHIEKNHQGKEHNCKACGKIFTRFEYLNKHIKNIHKKRKRNYNCDSCGKSFTLSGSLKKHIKKVHEK